MHPIRMCALEEAALGIQLVVAPYARRLQKWPVRVDGIGSIHCFAIDADTDEGWVHPALWIKLPDMEEKQDES